MIQRKPCCLRDLSLVLIRHHHARLRGFVEAGEVPFSDGLAEARHRRTFPRPRRNPAGERDDAVPEPMTRLDSTVALLGLRGFITAFLSVLALRFWGVGDWLVAETSHPESANEHAPRIFPVGRVQVVALV